MTIAWRYTYYSMKYRKHGKNVQEIARTDGTPLWFSRATPGHTHDLTAARAHGIVQACLADPLCRGPCLPGCRRHLPYPVPYRDLRTVSAVPTSWWSSCRGALAPILVVQSETLRYPLPLDYESHPVTATSAD